MLQMQQKGEAMTEVLRDIGVISRALDSIANIEFKDLDLTRGQYLYLVRIKENPGIIPDHLAEMIKVDRTTASRAIQKLEKNGFIEKRMTKRTKKSNGCMLRKKVQKVRHLFLEKMSIPIAPHCKILLQKKQKNFRDY